MGAPVWCEIVCRQCAHAMPGRWTYGRIPRAAMVKEAKRAGWCLINNDWCCDSEACRRKAAKESAPQR